MVHRQSSEVRFVGGAMVVFKPSCVVPLLQVDNVPNALYQHRWAAAGVGQERQQEAKRAQDVRLDNVYWPVGGNPNAATHCEEYDNLSAETHHERSLKHTVSRRRWKSSRKQARCAKMDWPF